MGEVFFYHLTQSALAATLRQLLEKSLAQGWRVAVRGPDGGHLDRLDAALWLGPEEAFVPHGRAGGPHDAHQPILLTTEPTAPNRPDCVVSIDGAPIAAEEMGALSRAMILFDGHDPAALGTARAQWKALTGAGIKAKYWSEESGRWAMKAES